MTTICLTNYSSSYFAGSVRITVKCEGYPCSKLFQRYEHKLNTPTGGKIYLYKGKFFIGSYFGTYATLQPENGYESSKLEKVYAYNNRFDSTNSFLVLVFCFKHGSPTVQNRYYPYSELGPLLGQNGSIKIKTLTEYTTESDILCKLLQENDALEKLLTYDIMQRPTPTSGDGGSANCTYNCNKITVKDDTSTGNGGPTLQDTEFKRYKHTPTSNGGKNNAGKKACVIYRCQALLKEGSNGGGEGAKELAGIQNQTYKCLSVYFGCRAKRPPPAKCQASGQCAPSAPGTSAGSSTCKKGQSTCPASTSTTTTACPDDVPLLLELHRNGKKGADNLEYYLHRRITKGSDEYYWERLPCGNGVTGHKNGDCVLKNLLEDIGLSTKKSGEGDNGYKKLQALLKQASINGATEASNGDQDLCQLIKKANGDKLQKLLGQQINGDSGSQNGQNTLITLLLKQVEFDLTDSLIILLDQTNRVSKVDYGSLEIVSAIGTLEPSGKQERINKMNLKSGSEVKITLSRSKEGLCECFTKYNYCVVAHDFSQAVQTKLGDKCSVGLRLLIRTKNSGTREEDTKYSELKLYSTSQTNPENLKYLYYTKGGANCDSKLYVVLYCGKGVGGSQGDPRPLLLGYQGCWYRPKDKDHFFDTWVKVDGLDDKSTGKCDCDTRRPGQTDCKTHQALLTALTKTVGFLNKVELQVYPGMTKGAKSTCENGTPSAATTCQSGTSSASTTTCKYTVHQFWGQEVKVQVTCGAVSGRTTGPRCYKKLTHKPIGTGSGGKTANEFRLGDVVYKSESCKIDYYNNGGSKNGNVSENNKWKPLISVSAYFYNEDKSYCDPLLVELVFKNVSPDTSTTTEYYKLTKTGSGMTWEKDKKASTEMKSNPSGHLDSIRYCLKQVVKICLEKNKAEKYALEVRNAKNGAANGFTKINNGAGTVQIQECKCEALTERGYKCFKHKLEEALKEKKEQVSGLVFTLPCSKNRGSNSEIKLHNGTSDLGEIEQLYYNICMGDICVCFYKEDPRPLLLCYNKCWYRPKSKDQYDQVWVKVDNLDKTGTTCDCLPDCNVANCPKHEKILTALTKVVRFLNQVELQMHPGMSKGTQSQCLTTATAGQGTCSATAPGPGTPTTCQPGTSGTNNNKCTYTVHRYNGSDVKVQVTCAGVNGTGSSTTSTCTQTPGSGCYKKLTHKPIGTNSGGTTTNAGFRLGNVVYCGNGCTADTCKIDYYGGLTASDKYAPLLSVTAYFYNHDTEYCDPLLVELHFAKVENGQVQNQNGANVEKEYYKLTERNGSKLTWAKDTGAPGKSGDDLVKHLDSIRYCLKQVVKIELQHNKTGQGYALEGRQAKNGLKNGFKPINGIPLSNGKIDVQECKCTGCEELAKSGYKCFKHDLTTALKSVHYQVAGLVFTIQGKKGVRGGTNGVIEILLEERASNGKDMPYANGSKTGKTWSKITYNKSSGDVYVYFHLNGNNQDRESKNIDPRPGLVCYNKKAYKPLKLPELEEETYNYNTSDYNKLVKVLDITKCGCEESEKLIKILNEIYNSEKANIGLIAGSSTGGLVGVVSIGGIVFFIYRKLTAAGAAAAAKTLF